MSSFPFPRPHARQFSWPDRWTTPSSWCSMLAGQCTSTRGRCTRQEAGSELRGHSMCGRAVAPSCKLLLAADGVWLRKADGDCHEATPLYERTDVTHIAAGYNAAAVLANGEVQFWPNVDHHERINPAHPPSPGGGAFAPPAPTLLPPLPGATKAAVWAPARPYLNYIANSRPAVALLTDVGDVWVFRDEWERVPALCSQGDTEIACGSCMRALFVRGVFLVVLPGPTVARLDGTVLQVTRLLPASSSFAALIPNRHDQADVPFVLLLGDDRVLYEASSPDLMLWCAACHSFAQRGPTAKSSLPHTTPFSLQVTPAFRRTRSDYGDQTLSILTDPMHNLQPTLQSTTEA